MAQETSSTDSRLTTLPTATHGRISRRVHPRRLRPGRGRPRFRRVLADPAHASAGRPPRSRRAADPGPRGMDLFLRRRRAPSWRATYVNGKQIVEAFIPAQVRHRIRWCWCTAAAVRVWTGWHARRTPRMGADPSRRRHKVYVVDRPDTDGRRIIRISTGRSHAGNTLEGISGPARRPRRRQWPYRRLHSQWSGRELGSRISTSSSRRRGFA
jgi:hypothetical protein